MDIKFLLIIIILAGVILLIFKALSDLFKKEKNNTEKEKQIEADFLSAIANHEQNLKDMENKYSELYNEFVGYKQQVEKAISEMAKYSDKIIEISDKIIAYDESFEHKLYVWSELLNNPENSDAVKEQIDKHLHLDIKAIQNFKEEQKRKQIEREKIIYRSLGLEL